MTDPRTRKSSTIGMVPFSASLPDNRAIVLPCLNPGVGRGDSRPPSDVNSKEVHVLIFDDEIVQRRPKLRLYFLDAVKFVIGCSKNNTRGDVALQNCGDVFKIFPVETDGRQSIDGALSFTALHATDYNPIGELGLSVSRACGKLHADEETNMLVATLSPTACRQTRSIPLVAR
jgi:hypothetical protein